MNSVKARVMAGQCWQLMKLMAVIVALALTVATGKLQAQTAVVEGSLSGFDVVNDSGQDVYGFEIRLEGAVQGDLYYTMFGQRYGNAKVVADATGVSIRYEAAYNQLTHSYSTKTPQHVPGSPFSWNDCYSAGTRYSVSGCEHFGQSLRNATNITKISGYWLGDDSANPGTLIRIVPPAAIPYPMWSIAPAVTVAPVVAAQIEAPEPPETPEKYGDAQWIKIYKTQLSRQVTADELSSDNTSVVPEDPSQIEITWDILQADPISGGNGKRKRGQKQNQGGISTDTRSVIRRYELYKYTGAYDAITHEVSCADGGLCNAPSVGELGDALGAQNSAANVTPDIIVVNLNGAGTGSVSSATGINCGTACVVFGTKGSSVTLTATPVSSTFAGWSGACTGTALTCSVTVSGITSVTATFNPPPVLGVVVNGSGEVRSNVGSIRCPSVCSNVYAVGTSVTLSAKGVKDVFTGWSGACSGTALNCTVVVNADTNVVANFAPAPTTGGGGGGSTTSTFRLSVSLNGKGAVVTDPTGQNFAPGTVVTLTATPASGSPWVGWSGACTGTATTCTLTMDANKSVTANFR